MQSNTASLLLAVEFSVDLGSVLRWAKPTVPSS